MWLCMWIIWRYPQWCIPSLLHLWWSLGSWPIWAISCCSNSSNRAWECILSHAWRWRTWLLSPGQWVHMHIPTGLLSPTWPMYLRGGWLRIFIIISCLTWPPSTTDLHILDYYIWDIIGRESNKQLHNMKKSLKLTIAEMVNNIYKINIIAIKFQCDIYFY